MTIFGTGYQRLEYRPTGNLRRLWALTWLELRWMFRTRWGAILFVLCQLPVVKSFIFLTIWSGFWDFGGAEARNGLSRMPGATNPSSADFYLAPALDPQPAFVFVLLLTTLVSARSIAKDRASQGLEILWTRGVTPRGYFVAKWAGSFLLVGIGSVLLPMLMWGLAQATAPNEDFVALTLPFLPRVAAALLFFVGAITGLATMLSAIVRSPNLASILWVVTMVGCAAFERALGRMFRGESSLYGLSPWTASKRIAESIAGVPPSVEFPVGVAVCWIGGFALSFGVLAVRRLRISEAVG